MISPEPSATLTDTAIYSQWTFEKVELNKEYIAPQNSGVKLTFTKLPDPSGNIKIEEITLTKEQIDQTGSLSDKAYDITSDMKDGDFTYNLSLPIPESSKGKAVEVKFAEEISKIGSAEKVESSVVDDTVSVNNLDHFTIFIVTDTQADYPTGTWTTWPVGGYNGSAFHYPTSAGAGDEAIWKFTSLPTGQYVVFTSWSTDPNRSTSVNYKINHAGVGSPDNIVGINQEKLNDQTTTGTANQWSGWYRLGVYQLNNTSNLTLTTKDNSSHTEYVIADEVALVSLDEVWIDDNWASNAIGDEIGAGKIFGGNAFANIQAGITAVATGGTVNVAAGTYTEVGQIVIDKNLSIVGADKATTIIKPAQNTGVGNHLDVNSWILVNSGVTFNLSKITLDGTGKLINHGILSHGHGTIDDNIFTNIAYNQSGPDYKGIGIELYGSDMRISNNSFSNIGRIGVYTGFGSIATIIGNTYIGKGIGNFLDYGFEVGRNGQATISNNIISNNKGVASIDGSTSAGILVTSYFNPETPSQATITGNVISNSTIGVAVGYADGDLSIINQFNTNTFSLNDYDLDNHTNNNINARNNTWSVTDQNSLDQIEAKINHYCSGSTYVHGVCSGTNDYSTGGMVQYKDIGTPSNLGWNVGSKSSTPNETPLDLACPASTVYTNENNVAQNWSMVSGANIKYQREVTYPSNATSNFEAGSNTYTPFSTFGSATGIEGLWKTRVRAYVDANNSNTYSSDEEVSDWSNECNITLDKTIPTVPVLTAPIDGAIITDNTPLMQWDDSTDIGGSGIDGYLYRVYYNCADANNSSTCSAVYPNSTGLWLTNSQYQAGTTSDGTYYWQVKAQDKAGNQSGWSELEKVTIDTIASIKPTGLKFQNTARTQDFACGAVIQLQPVTPDWNTITDDPSFSHYEYTSFLPNGSIGLNEQVFTASEFPNTWMPPADGAYGYAVRSVDFAGNKSNWALSAKTLAGSCQIIYDSTAPAKPVFTAPENNLFTKINSVTLTWSGGDDTGTTQSGIKGYTIRYTFVPMGGGATIPWTSGLIASGNPKTHSGSYGHGQGTYTIYVSTTDNAENVSSESDPLVLIYDATAPTTEFTSPEDGFTTNLPIEISGSSTDIPNTTVDYVTLFYSLTGEDDWSEIDTISNNGSEPFNWNYSWEPEEDGTYDIKAEVTDDAGNTENSPVVENVTYDATAPAEPTATPTAGDYTSAGVEVSLSSSDDGNGLASIYYTTDGSSPDTSGTRVSYPLDNSAPITVNHDLTLKAIAYDNAGNQSEILSAVYGIPPVISGEASTRASDTSLTISWLTDDLSTSRVVYDTVSHAVLGAGPNYGYANSTVEDTAKVTSHSVTITGLTTNVTYYYRVISHGSPEAVAEEQTYTINYVFGLPGDGLSDGLSDGKSSGGGAAPSGGNVLGISTLAGANVLGIQEEQIQEQDGQVLGTESASPTLIPTSAEEQNPTVNSANSFFGNNIILLLIFLFIVGLLYYLYRKRKRKEIK